MNGEEPENAHDKLNAASKGKSATKQTFEEFCEESTIHGIKYVGAGTHNEKYVMYRIF